MNIGIINNVYQFRLIIVFDNLMVNVYNVNKIIILSIIYVVNIIIIQRMVNVKMIIFMYKIVKFMDFKKKIVFNVMMDII